MFDLHDNFHKLLDCRFRNLTMDYEITILPQISIIVRVITNFSKIGILRIL